MLWPPFGKSFPRPSYSASIPCKSYRSLAKTFRFPCIFSCDFLSGVCGNKEPGCRCLSQLLFRSDPAAPGPSFIYVFSFSLCGSEASLLPVPRLSYFAFLLCFKNTILSPAPAPEIPPRLNTKSLYIRPSLHPEQELSSPALQ